MIIKTVNLETVIGVTSKLPENHLPEFAFSGKSNVDQRADEPEGLRQDLVPAG